MLFAAERLFEWCRKKENISKFVEDVVNSLNQCFVTAATTVAKESRFHTMCVSSDYHDKWIYFLSKFYQYATDSLKIFATPSVNVRSLCVDDSSHSFFPL